MDLQITDERNFTGDTYGSLSKIQCPVLVLDGGQDKAVSPKATLEMAEKLGCESVMYEKYGHSAYEEVTDFNKKVKAFLD